MHGQHARPTSVLFSVAPATERRHRPRRARHSRRGQSSGRFRRRILAYRAIDFLSSRIPGDPHPGEECLLLVHVRKVVGQVHYRICTDCAEAVITDVVIEEPFQHTGLATRALSHLRSRHPGMTWRSTLSRRATRDLLRRMHILLTPADTRCPHARPPADPAPTTF